MFPETTLYGSKLIAFGTAPKPGDVWHRIQLTCRDNLITALLDGKTLAQIHNYSSFEGMAGLATGWNRAWFKHFTITALPGLFPTNLAQGAKATASSQWSGTYSAQKVCDGKLQTRWNAAKGDLHGAWVALTLPHRQRVGTADIMEWGNRINTYKFQYYAGTKMARSLQRQHGPRTRSRRPLYTRKGPQVSFAD